MFFKNAAYEYGRRILITLLEQMVSHFEEISEQFRANQSLN